MRRPLRPDYNAFRIVCRKCSRNLPPSDGSPVDSGQRCEHCHGSLRVFKCIGPTCGFREKICTTCYLDSFQQWKNKTEQHTVRASKASEIKIEKWMLILLVLVLGGLLYCWNSYSESLGDSNVHLMKRLRAGYPSQKNETWYHVLSVLEKTIPSVKSITFLHEEDKRTSNCLVSEMVSLYTANSKIKMEDVTFSTTGFEGKDYGFSLEHYHTVVERFRVLVTDLTEISGNIARIFHSLCDEVSSDIKPSLFIFKLKCDKKTENLKPIERAGNILRAAWSSLPQNEISPLLSRIIKNVVYVVPERQINC